MSWALVPAPTTSTDLPATSRLSLSPLECRIGPPKFSAPSNFGMFGRPLTPIATTMWRGCMVRVLPSASLISASQRRCASS